MAYDAIFSSFLISRPGKFDGTTVNRNDTVRLKCTCACELCRVNVITKSGSICFQMIFHLEFVLGFTLAVIPLYNLAVIYVIC